MKKAIKILLILTILVTYAIDIFLIYFFSLVLSIWEETHTQPGLTEKINVNLFVAYLMVAIIVFIILTVIVVLIIRREKKKALEISGSREVQAAVIRKYNVIVCVSIVTILFLFFCSHMLLRGL
jgi:magnesium-transporting ATPase (P-type)